METPQPPSISDYPSTLGGQSTDMKSGIGDFADLLLDFKEGPADQPWLLRAHSGHVFFGENPFYYFAQRRHELIEVNGMEASLARRPRDGSPLSVYPLFGPPATGSAVLEATVFSRDSGDTLTLSRSVTGSVPPFGLFFRVGDATAEDLIRPMIPAEAGDCILRSFRLDSQAGDLDFRTSANGQSPLWARAKNADLSPLSMRRTYFLDNKGRLVLYNRHVAHDQKVIHLPDAEIDQVFVSQGAVEGVQGNAVTLDAAYPEVEVYYTVKHSYLLDGQDLVFSSPQEWVLVEYEAEESDLWGDTLLNVNPIQAKVKSSFIYLAPRDRLAAASGASGGTAEASRAELRLTVEDTNLVLDGGRMRITCETLDFFGSPLPYESVLISTNDPRATFVDPDVVNGIPVASIVKQTDGLGQFTVELVAPDASLISAGAKYGVATYGEARYTGVDGYSNTIGELIVSAETTDKLRYDLSAELHLTTFSDATNRPKLTVSYGATNRVQFAARLPVFQWALPAARLTDLAYLPWDGGYVAVASRSDSGLYLVPAASGLYQALATLTDNRFEQTGLSRSACLAVTPDGTLWVGGKEGLTAHDMGLETPYPLDFEVSAMVALGNDVLVLGTDQGQVLRLDVANNACHLLATLPGRVSALLQKGGVVSVGTSEPAALHVLDLSSWSLLRGATMVRHEIPGAQQVWHLAEVSGELAVETESGTYHADAHHLFARASHRAILDRFQDLDPVESLRSEGKIWHGLRVGDDYWFVRDGVLGVWQQREHDNLQCFIPVSLELRDSFDRKVNGEPVTMEEGSCQLFPASQLFTGQPYVGHMRGRLIESATVSASADTLEGRWYVSTGADPSVVTIHDAQNVARSEIPGVSLAFRADRTPYAMAVVHTSRAGFVTFYVGSSHAGKHMLMAWSDNLGALAPVLFEAL